MAGIEELKRNMSEKMMLQKDREKKKKKKQKGDRNNNKFLVAINIVGSTGPLKFVVNQDDLVAGVIHDTALKAHARGGRLPVLGSDVKGFLLYCAHGGSDALNPWEPIGTSGERKFVLCKVQFQPQMTEGRAAMLSKKASAWKAWLNKSLSFKILSH